MRRGSKPAEPNLDLPEGRSHLAGVFVVTNHSLESNQLSEVDSRASLRFRLAAILPTNLLYQFSRQVVESSLSFRCTFILNKRLCPKEVHRTRCGRKVTDSKTRKRSLKGQKGAGEFAFLGASAHHGGKDGDFHAEGADGRFLRRVAAVDDESAGEIGVEFGDG